MVDTSCFYNEREMKIHNKLNRLYLFRQTLKKRKNKKNIEQKVIRKIDKYITNTNRRIGNLKDKLYQELQCNTGVRKLNEDCISIKNVISMFESTLTRTLKIPIDTLTTDLFIVQTYFFDVLKDIVLNGFIYKGEKYIYFTSSAGQIRTKKSVFIKESLFKQHHNTLMCGLTIDDINSQGGVNINKYLAYLALCNSATDEWVDFNIDKAIVVDDMETMVEGVVDFISDKTYKITRKNMQVPIEHTDGCGMILPRKSKKNMMVRLPWIKGLLSPFSFDEFIHIANKNINKDQYGKVKDIYGKEWDLIKDDIEVIFTKSQFKMWRYYPNKVDENGKIIKYGWDIYKEYYKKYNCQAGKCNEEKDIFENSEISYQMLQTLTDITYKELEKICYKTKKDILNIGNDRKTMLKVLGVTKSNLNKNYLQQAIEIYPELLNDTYSKKILKDVKRSMTKNAWAGKIKVNGKYTFIIPDLYAFCEFLILGDKNPKGLLQNGEVYCNLYRKVDKLDCLRSPHLFREHAIRKNTIDEEKDKWFITKGLYTSCHDLISRILQFDVDGDTSLVVASKDFIEIAERNMQDIVPLYYEMKTAKKELINNNTIYNGLISAYKGGNIGMISNDITKVWNSKNVDLDVIKLLCMESNFTIDYAKTLYKPKRPPELNKRIRQYTKNKVPHFFIYAKNKSKKQVEERNNSTVNMLRSIIPNKNIDFKSIGLNNFDYKMLMDDSDVDITTDNAIKIIDKYVELDLKKYFIINKDEDDNDKIKNILYMYKIIREDILKVNTNVNYVTDVLIEYLYGYKESNFKTTLWSSFGDVIVEN
ncbi:MAG TPA: hypothetical protein GX708_16950, partial [Gallicola sp.]|nr:hypothetical protein [Gallicola sp.]